MTVKAAEACLARKGSRQRAGFKREAADNYDESSSIWPASRDHRWRLRRQKEPKNEKAA